MKFLRFIISLYLLSNISSLLTKYGTEVLTTNDVIFESKDFKDNEEMHFKIQSHEYNFNENYYYNVEYNYFSDADVNVNSISYPHHEYFKKTSYDGNLKTKYFTIKKTGSEYTPSNGNYLYIQFPNLLVSPYERATITNTKEDEGKIETWVIIVIVVVIVAIIVGIIIFCVCRRIRMKKAQQAAIAANSATIAAQNQAAANYAAQNAAYEAAAQNAAYEAAAQNAYIAEQNYQAQANQAQVYQNNNYMTPPGVISNAGYTSNAVM